MLTVRKLLVFPLTVLIMASSPAFADQQHIVAPNQLAATVTDRVANQDAARASIAEALARPEARDIAAAMGLDLSRVANAASTLNGADLDRAASTAREVNQQLVGGASTVVISTTTLIIILLLIILLVVAVK